MKYVWTCVNAATMYGCAKVPTEIDGAQDRGACDLPRNSYSMDWSTWGWNRGAPLLSPNGWGRWKTCSVEIWSQLMSTTHCDYNAACVWLTFPHDTGHWIDHQGELPCVFSVTLTYMMYKEDDIDMGQTSNQVHMSLWIVTARKLWMSYDRGGWGLILQCYECM